MYWFSAIGSFLGNLVAGFFTRLFGKSTEEKLGIAETQLKQDAAILKGVEDDKAIRDKVDAQPPGAANEWLHHHDFHD